MIDPCCYTQTPRHPSGLAQGIALIQRSLKTFWHFSLYYGKFVANRGSQSQEKH